MKNLKKVLALVLVVATLMTMTTIASAAAYTDANSIQYTEAVEVMSELGILEGFTDGSFKPTNSLTRAQAAKMVAYILNGGTDVNDLYSGANTFSDCTTNWAKGYIAYVNQTGIVAGVGGGKFSPNGTLTGVQLAKMMLGALGYDAVIEKYQNDAAWMVNVLDDAQSAGLLKGLETANMYGAITREQASQMMFNALQATMVRYENKGTEFEINGVPVIIGASDPEAVAQGSYRNNMHEGTNDVNTQTLQLAERYFSGTSGLEKLSLPTGDDFGRPAHQWKYDRSVIGDYADEADLTYTTEVEAEDIYADLGKVADDDAKRYTDGKTGTNEDKVNINVNQNTKIGGQGALTEVYVDDNNNIKIVVINTYVGSINKYTAATNTVDAYITIKNEGKAPAGTLNTRFDTDAFDKDDEDSYVLYTVADGNIKSVTVPETVEGSVSKYGSSEITMNGTAYKLSSKYKLERNDDFDGTYTFYLDTYGNVIFSTVVEAGSQNYAYITKIEESNSLSAGTGVLAEVYLTDGTKSVVSIATNSSGYDLPLNTGKISGSKEAVDGNVNKTNSDSYNVGRWFSYTVNSDKEYTFAEIDSNYAAEAGTGTVTLTKDTAQVVAGKYTTANTVIGVFDGEDVFSTATGLVSATLDGGKQILVTYNKGSNAITAIYAVGVTTGVAASEVTYAYALDPDGTTADGKSWKFVVDGKEVSYTVESGTPVNGAVYTLTLNDKGNISNLGSDKATDKTGGKNMVVDYADANTVAFTSAIDGKKMFVTTEDFAVYNVVADTVGADTLEAGDTVTCVLEAGKIAVAFITKEAT